MNSTFASIFEPDDIREGLHLFPFHLAKKQRPNTAGNKTKISLCKENASAAA